VDSDAHVPRAARFFEHVSVFAVAAPHHRTENHQPAPGRHRFDLIDDLLDRLARNRFAAVWAVWQADPRIHETEIVMNFGHGPDCRTWVVARAFLIDADRR